MVLADENGDYLVDENGNYITPTDENGNVTYNPGWKAYSSSEALEQDVSKFKKETSATFEILNDGIDSKVSSVTFDALGTRVSTAESTITQHSTDIASKVAQTDYTGNTIASLINQTATTVAIQASKINLAGAVTITDLDKTSVTPSALGAATPNDVSTAQTNAQTYATTNCVKTDASNAPSSLKNSSVTIGADGALTGAGGGKVTIGGLGYTGALDATKGAPSGTYVGSTLAQTVESNAANALSNAATAQSTADGKITTFYQTSAPTTGMSDGDIWFDTDDNNKIYIYQSNSWTLARDSGIAQAINAASAAQTTANTGVSNAATAQTTANNAATAASTAQTTANKKVETYFSTTQPTATTVGDLWYNTDTALLKRWDGSTWVTVSNGYTNTNQLTDGANLGGTATWNGVSGSGKPADNATVGATWGTNLLNIPTTLGTPSAVGLYLTATSMGYWDGTGFKTYMDNIGNFKCGNPSATTKGLSWNQTNGTLVIGGEIYVTGGNAATTTDINNSLTTANTNAQGYATAAQTTASIGLPSTMGGSTW